MLVDTLERFAELSVRMPHERLQLTLDVGHLHCLGEVPLADQIARFAPQIVNIHIEDMRAGMHEHLMFGEGEMDFPPVIAALHRPVTRGRARRTQPAQPRRGRGSPAGLRIPGPAAPVAGEWTAQANRSRAAMIETSRRSAASLLLRPRYPGENSPPRRTAKDS